MVVCFTRWLLSINRFTCVYYFSADLPEELRAKLFASGPELLKRAINLVSGSEEFQIPTPRNAACRVAALHIAEWLQAGNSAAFEGFCKLLLCLLVTCFEKTSKVLTNAQKTIWSNFHAVRISPELKHLWVSNFEHIVQKPLDGFCITWAAKSTLILENEVK